MKCFHHVDADGYCAAYWVHKRYPVMKSEDFIAINYGMDINPYDIIEKDEMVIIVDFSFEPEVLEKIYKDKTTNIIWIDHHISAINKYKDFPYEIKGLRYNGIAGCMLTYCYFNEMEYTDKFEENLCFKAPWMTKYIADYDVWKFEYGNETRHFKLALDATGLPHPCDDSSWDKLLDIENVRKMIDNGSVIEKYRNSLAKLACDSVGFEKEIEGYKFFCMNIANCITNSEWFGDMISKYDAVCSYSYNGKDNKWIYSLYSEKIDVSKIAQKYGGGGHKGASGFNLPNNIFN